MVLLAAAALVAAAPPANLEQQAMALYREGAALYQRGEYAKAIQAFRAADGLAPSPDYIFNIAQAYRHLGDCENALAFFREYVRLRPPASAQKVVRDGLADMDACVRQAGVAPVVPEPEPERPAAPPVMKPEPAPARAQLLATVEQRGESRMFVPGIAIGAIGVVAAGVGVGLWASAAGDYHALQAQCGTACNPSLIVDPQRKLFVGYGMVAGGATAILAGAALAFAGRVQARSATTWVAPAPGGICVAGTFGP
jgi:tetratricopeptide (TPR) repeat protein